MKIGYWLDTGDIHAGGTGPYAWRILELFLGHIDSNRIDFRILCSPASQIEVQKRIDTHSKKFTIHLIPDRFSFLLRSAKQAAGMLARAWPDNTSFASWTKRLDPWYRWLASINLDLLHVPYIYPPSFSLPCPFIVTMHDFQELHFPEFFSPQIRAFRAENNWRATESCGGVVVSFAHVKDDLLNYFAMPESKVFVCPLPYQEITMPRPTPEEDEKYQAKYAPWKNFLLYPAQTWRHKNHLALIKAIEFIQQRHGRKIQVLCTGKKNALYFPVLEKHLVDSTVAEQIHFLDVVPASELCWLYQHCALVVVPTLYEAGSFPLIEAMSLGAPVICSSVTSLPDTIADSRFLFDPHNPEDMAQRILQLLDDTPLRNENIANSRQRTQELRTLDSFPFFRNAWEKILGQRAN